MGGGRERKRKTRNRTGEETVNVSVTDSCQENESAVFQPTTHTFTHSTERAPEGGPSTLCLVKGREGDVGNTPER